MIWGVKTIFFFIFSGGKETKTFNELICDTSSRPHSRTEEKKIRNIMKWSFSKQF